jgi:hypothetical protein
MGWACNKRLAVRPSSRRGRGADESPDPISWTVVVRPGNAVVSWGISSSTAGQIATAIRYQHGTTENVVFQDVSGSIYIAKNPT